MNKKEFREGFTQGNLLMMEHFYDTALATFLHIRAMDTTNANVNYKIGVIYLQTRAQKPRAERFLAQAITNIAKKYVEDEPGETQAPPLALLYYAEALHINYNFQSAIDFYNKFKDYPGKKNPELIKDIERQKEMCFNGIELTKTRVPCVIVNLGDSVNSPYGDYSPLISADEEVLMFTSTRKGTGGEANQTPEGTYFEDIWVCYKKHDGTWSEAKNMGPPINTYENEATIGLSADGQQLFIYKDDNGDGNIYISELNGDIWSAPEKMGDEEQSITDINSKSFEPSASITADGNTIYFVSDRKGGYGGTDIYRVVRLPNGKWSKAQNLGPTINTPYDEDAPFMHPDGKTLFFSSKGHKTMGGFDVFYSTKFDSGWAPPVNVGYPINTTEDDVFYVTSADGKRAYYSSVKAGGKGDQDLYRVDFQDADYTGPVVVLTGRVTYNGGDSLPSGVNISIKDNITGELLPDVKPNSKSGKYILVLTPGEMDSKEFTVTYSADSLDPIVQVVKVEKKNDISETEKSITIRDVNFEDKKIGTISVSGVVKGSDGKTINAVKINVTDNVSGKLLNTYYSNDVSGAYYFVVKMGQNYNVSFEAEGYLFQSINVNIPKKPQFSEIKKDVVLEKIKVGVKMTLNNIFFDSGKSTLRKESNVELDKVIKLMKQNPEIKFEISGHTDSKGDDKQNLVLSQARAKAVVDYLVKKGVDKKRLIAKGYGETQPVAPNTLPNGKPDPEGMQLNRRVEMKVVE